MTGLVQMKYRSARSYYKGQLPYYTRVAHAEKVQHIREALTVAGMAAGFLGLLMMWAAGIV